MDFTHLWINLGITELFKVLYLSYFQYLILVVRVEAMPYQIYS